MKKRIFSIILTLLLFSNMFFTVKAEVQFLYGYVVQKAMSTGISQKLQLKITDASGVEAIYTCDKKTRVNGMRYSSLEEIDSAITEDAFVKMAVEDGVITVLNSATGSERYENVSYNKKTRTFDGLRFRKSGLPIYYKYDDSFVPAYVDENHFYDIEVYDYAVCIINMVSKAEPQTIKFIETGSGIDSRFSRYINIYCETDANEEYVLKGELYNEKSKLIERAEAAGQSEFDLTFDSLKNSAKSYMIKLWLEDSGNNRVSSIYMLNAKLKQNDIIYGDIVIKHTRTVGGKEQEILNIRDINGNERVFVCDENVLVVSPISFYSLTDTEIEVPENTFAKFAAEDDVVKVILPEINTLEVSSSDFALADNQLAGSVCIMNNTHQPYSFSCVSAIFDSSDKLKTIVATPVDIDANTDINVYPAFDNYNHAEGDYVRIFAWNGDSISPVFGSLQEGITAE